MTQALCCFIFSSSAVDGVNPWTGSIAPTSKGRAFIQKAVSVMMRNKITVVVPKSQTS